MITDAAIALCKDHSASIWVDGMLASAFGHRYSRVLLAKDNISCPFDIFLSSQFFEEDFSIPGSIFSEKGKINQSLNPGFDFIPKME